MANFNFGEFKKKAAQKAEELAGKSVAALNTAADKASVVAKKTKLNAEIAAEKEQMKKSYMALGQLYFEKYGENVDPDFAQIIAELNISAAKIEEKKDEIAKLNEEAELTEEAEVEVETEAEESECGCGCGEKSEETEKTECCCGNKSEETEPTEEPTEDEHTEE